MRIVQPHTMAEIDRLAQEQYGISGLLLMENAGIKAFRHFLVEWSPRGNCNSSLLFLAGGGNNGGDALVMARQAFLEHKFQVKVVLRGKKMNEQVSTHYTIVKQLGIPVIFWDSDEKSARQLIKEADVVFDGISGTGISGALRGSAAGMVQAVNDEAEGFIVAIDVPSGLGDNYITEYPAVNADLTLTMGLPKIPLYTPAGRIRAGTVRTIQLGFPPQLLESPPYQQHDYRGELIESSGKTIFQPQDYKNVRGHAAIWAGDVGTTGAAALAAEGAGRAGAGLVSLFVDPDIYPVLSAKLTETMVRPNTQAPVGELPSRFSALLVGPGWGRTERETMLEQLLRSGVPGVIDADGISVFRYVWNKLGSTTLNELIAGRWILTPHPGEYIALVKDSEFEVDKSSLFSNPLEAMAPLARKLQVVIVLKTHVVWVMAPDGRFAVVDGMNPAMGTGGSGDVLSGVIAGIRAAGVETFEAAYRGAALHQEAGRKAFQQHGWFLAGELARAVSAVIGGDEHEAARE